MNFKYWILYVGFVLFSLGGQAQVDSVRTILLKIKACEEDSLKIAYADQIPNLLKMTEFGSQRKNTPVQYLGYRYCSNSAVELFSWSIPLSEGLAYYNWFRFRKDDEIYLLRILPGEGNEDMPACYFYDLLAFNSQKREYFALFGWSQGQQSNHKGVWIARFDKGGKINFKSRLIKNGKNRAASLAFEYAKDGSMVLKHDKNGRRIIFDHLTPIDKKYEGFFMFYGPDGSYDALILDKGVWKYENDVKVGKFKK